LQILIAGAGNLGSKIATLLASNGESVSLIDEDKARCEWLSKKTDATVYNGSVFDPLLLMNAGIEKTDSIITALDDDEKAAKFISFAKSQFGVPKIFAIANHSESEGLLIEAGATRVICPEDEVLGEIENAFSSGNGHRIIDIDKRRECEIASVTIRATSSVLGKDLSKVKGGENCRIVALLRDRSLIFPSPAGVNGGDRRVREEEKEKEGEVEGLPLEMGDELLIVGKPESVARFVEKLN
jgi:trk system potassium uptake protein TrkA